MNDKPKTAPPASNPLKGLVSDAKASAEQAPKRETGTVKAGPFEVGGTGSVSVIERPVSANSDKSYLYAEYVPVSGGRAKSIPLAAVAVLAEQMA